MDVLPLDVCYLIVKKLKAIARIRLGTVSRLWRQITKLIEDEDKPPMFPWVMLHPLDSSYSLEFLSIEDDYATLKLNLRSITALAAGRNQYHCCGGSCNKKGWMVIYTASEKEAPHPSSPSIRLWLINPLSGVAIRLPYHKKKGPYFIRKVLLSSDPCASNCVVVVIEDIGEAYFCRLGEQTWTILDELQILDMVFYKGQFLGYNLLWKSFMVFEYDHDLGNSKVYHAPMPLEYGNDDRFVYMVESCGEVLLVLRNRRRHPWPDPWLDTFDHNESEPLNFLVFKLDSIKYEWVRMDSLGDTILFVGLNGSTSVSAKDFPAMNLKGNCIYFMMSTDEHSFCKRCINFGVYYLEDGRVEPLLTSETHPPNAKSPLIWFIPK